MGRLSNFRFLVTRCVLALRLNLLEIPLMRDENA